MAEYGNLRNVSVALSANYFIPSYVTESRTLLSENASRLHVVEDVDENKSCCRVRVDQ